IKIGRCDRLFRIRCAHHAVWRFIERVDDWVLDPATGPAEEAIDRIDAARDAAAAGEMPCRRARKNQTRHGAGRFEPLMLSVPAAAPASDVPERKIGLPATTENEAIDSDRFALGQRDSKPAAGALPDDGLGRRAGKLADAVG